MNLHEIPALTINSGSILRRDAMKLFTHMEIRKGVGASEEDLKQFHALWEGLHGAALKLQYPSDIPFYEIGLVDIRNSLVKVAGAVRLSPSASNLKEWDTFVDFFRDKAKAWLPAEPEPEPEPEPEAKTLNPDHNGL